MLLLFFGGKHQIHHVKTSSQILLPYCICIATTKPIPFRFVSIVFYTFFFVFHPKVCEMRNHWSFLKFWHQMKVKCTEHMHKFRSNFATAKAERIINGKFVKSILYEFWVLNFARPLAKNQIKPSLISIYTKCLSYRVYICRYAYVISSTHCHKNVILLRYFERRCMYSYLFNCGERERKRVKLHMQNF